ncbi:arginine--tRNA ligase [Desulfoluna butyratoxydans]|uniref:Arginine--tRNA ligase n=1 Tax=Desulfoluna butyratoxydans TaxID=231438 RepID=A0A4U8YPT7_9BACT|nr:arginine--tRNA ligase [Desulfoluna butyratoxydans]VFQ43712.1 arginine-trna ligase [Desulfoluna butyratoxydans]
MKQTIKTLIEQAARAAFEKGALPSDAFPPFTVEEPKVESQGDFATNIAMVMAKAQKMAPRKIAEALVAEMALAGSIVDKVEIAGPGFINLFLDKGAWLDAVTRVEDKGDTYGASTLGEGKKVMVEFVSANPTGPLHVGHGRGAAVGDSTARILSFAGFDVDKEYYINDSGRQIRTLGLSLFLRYKELCGTPVDFPEDCYQGAYIIDMAQGVKADKGDSLLEMPEDEAVLLCARHAASLILEGIKTDLEAFGVPFDCWFSEQSLYDNGLVPETIETLKAKGTLYENDGALWFKTSEYGDEKDRVVVRSNGQTTYFASDIAYHMNKFDRGYQRLIDVWGADHHGYIPRINASITATGHNKDDFDVILVQLVNLLRGGEPVAMSTRSGEFVTLKDVVDEVGADAARFIFLSRHYDSPLDFDLELAKKKTNDNPVFYVQYVHARISSILEKAKAERGLTVSAAPMESLTQPEEIALMKAMLRFPEVVETAAKLMEPHRISYYLMDLASAFHSYYNKHKVLTDDAVLSAARLRLVASVRQVIKTGLALLGVSAPEKM